MRVIIQEEALRKSEGRYYHRFIQELPTIDAAPVVHGRWIETDYFDAHKVPIYECSACFQEVADHYIKCHKYCLHCGAKMDAEESTND